MPRDTFSNRDNLVIKATKSCNWIGHGLALAETLVTVIAGCRHGGQSTHFHKTRQFWPTQGLQMLPDC